MPSATTPVDRFLCTSKRCLKVFRSFAVRRKKPRTEEKSKAPTLRRRETFYFSSTSLDKRRSADSESIDTIITWLEDACCLDNHINESLENNGELLLL